MNKGGLCWREKEIVMKDNEKKRNSKELERFAGILYEKFLANQNLLAEKIESVEQTMNVRLNEFRDEVNENFDIVKAVLRGHSKDISELKSDVSVLKSDVAVLKSDVSVLKSDVAQLKTNVVDINETLSRMELKNSDRFDNHENRLERLERLATPRLKAR